MSASLSTWQSDLHLRATLTGGGHFSSKQALQVSWWSRPERNPSWEIYQDENKKGQFVVKCRRFLAPKCNHCYGFGVWNLNENRFTKERGPATNTLNRGKKFWAREKRRTNEACLDPLMIFFVGRNPRVQSIMPKIPGSKKRTTKSDARRYIFNIRHDSALFLNSIFQIHNFIQWLNIFWKINELASSAPAILELNFLIHSRLNSIEPRSAFNF